MMQELTMPLEVAHGPEVAVWLWLQGAPIGSHWRSDDAGRHWYRVTDEDDPEPVEVER